MATVGDAASLAYQARRVYTEELVKGLPTLINFVANWAASPERSTTTTTDAWQLQRIRDLVADMRQRGVRTEGYFCTCAGLGLIGAIADGVGEARKRARTHRMS